MSEFEKQDFITVFPKAVLVLSTLSSGVLGKEWCMKLLTVALGSYLGLKDISQAAIKLYQFTIAGLKFALLTDVREDSIRDSKYCQKVFKRVFPHPSETCRLGIVTTSDFANDFKPVTLIWMFPENRTKIILEERGFMKKPEGITSRTDLPGICDLCNVSMEQSGGLVTSRAMRLLIEGGFDPFVLGKFNNFFNEKLKTMELPMNVVSSLLRQPYLKEELGDFGICPDCFKAVCDFFE